MRLLTIRAAGFTATVDACAQDGGQIWFLSLLGSLPAVALLGTRVARSTVQALSRFRRLYLALGSGGAQRRPLHAVVRRPHEAASTAMGWKALPACLSTVSVAFSSLPGG